MSRPPKSKTASTRDTLRRKIERLKPNTRLPSERQLAVDLGVSRMTLRQALDELQQEGRIYTVRGSGTFVSQFRVSKRMTLTSFSQDMLARGMTPSSVVISAEVATPPQELVEAWGINVARVYRVRRLRLGDDLPVCVEDAYFEVSAAPDLLAQDLTGSIYALLKEHYGRGISTAMHTVAAIAVEGETATLLDVPAGTPALEFTQVGFDASGSPVEYCVSTKRADIFDVRYSVQA